MKTLITAIAAAFLAASFTVPVEAAGTQKKETTGMSSNASANKAACKAEAKKKFSALHPLKRRDFEKKCMGHA